MNGYVFNIQHYSIHDGPGIRTTVFMNGCPLRCVWCQNPESQPAFPPLLFSEELCVGCGTCVPVCPEGAVELVEGKSRTNRELCVSAGECVQACPQGARSIMGRIMTAEQVFQEAEADSVFYESSGGGVTLSGGEPLAQPGFAAGILGLCKESGLHTTVDTSGYAAWPTFRRVLEHTDLVLYDLKHMDSAEHAAMTGVPNEAILENAERLSAETEIPVYVRFPLIPGWNDSSSNLDEMARFVVERLRRVAGVSVHPFHKLGEAKYERMGMDIKCAGIEPPSEKATESVRSFLESYGLEVKVGG